MNSYIPLNSIYSKYNRNVKMCNGNVQMIPIVHIVAVYKDERGLRGQFKKSSKG